MRKEAEGCDFSEFVRDTASSITVEAKLDTNLEKQILRFQIPMANPVVVQIHY